MPKICRIAFGTMSIPKETERPNDERGDAIEELAGKFPNEVIVPFKVERINEVLDALRESIKRERGLSDRPLYPFGFLRLIEEGLTYSDVLLMMKWYKVLPR